MILTIKGVQSQADLECYHLGPTSGPCKLDKSAKAVFVKKSTQISFRSFLLVRSQPKWLFYEPTKEIASAISAVLYNCGM